MNRQILLVEPNYNNKYPPMGLMKLATYFRERKDSVRFYKGDLRNLTVDLICEDLLQCLDILSPDVFWRDYYPQLFNYIKLGKNSSLESIDVLSDDILLAKVQEYRAKYVAKDYFKNPRFDIVAVTTLFTFYWDITIDTINFVKNLCKTEKGVMVGGIMSTLHPEEVFEATGIHPIVGLLNKPRMIDKDNTKIIDSLPLDYSILDEIEYVYPTNDAYFAYMTRGCINHCSFCAVPKLEPEYCDYISLKKQIDIAKKRFGEQRNLMLLDNNVLASKDFNKIIDEIKKCGFAMGEKYKKQNQYEIIIKNLMDGYNDRAYIRKAVRLYHEIMNKLTDENTKTQMYLKIEEAHCLFDYSATKEAILGLDSYIRPLYDQVYKESYVKRIVDFNQGIDSRLINSENMGRLAELSIEPLRIAFDHWELKDVYEQSVRYAVKSGIKKLSNYLLYNFQDKPEHLYERLKLNVELCDELDASIYSFPMKYHPINDPDYFKNRDYIGKYWNRKFIRAVQAVLNSTKGKIGKGKNFFEQAFGKNKKEFNKILWMPEAFIIYRRKYDAKLREKISDKYSQQVEGECDLANEWWDDFQSLSVLQKRIAKKIIANNVFTDEMINVDDKDIKKVLEYYRISRSQ